MTFLEMATYWLFAQPMTTSTFMRSACSKVGRVSFETACETACQWFPIRECAVWRRNITVTAAIIKCVVTREVATTNPVHRAGISADVENEIDEGSFMVSFRGSL